MMWKNLSKLGKKEKNVLWSWEHPSLSKSLSNDLRPNFPCSIFKMILKMISDDILGNLWVGLYGNGIWEHFLEVVLSV